MKVTLFRQLTLQNNVVVERFTVNPKKSLLLDEHRNVLHFVELLVHHYSVESLYKLLSVRRGEYLYEKTYEYNEKVPPPPSGLTLSFDYTPYVGKRSCKKCTHYVQLRRGGACSGRLKKLKYTVWENCNYWNENSVLKNLVVT